MLREFSQFHPRWFRAVNIFIFQLFSSQEFQFLIVSFVNLIFSFNPIFFLKTKPKPNNTETNKPKPKKRNNQQLHFSLGMHEQPWETNVQVFHLNQAKQRVDPRIPALQASNMFVTLMQNSGKKISAC